MSRRSKGQSGPTGIAVVDKPAGMTSHDVVGAARKALGTRKVGHAGTLDPDATGVLVLGVGKATRLLQYIVGASKRYTGEVVFGTETSTLDAAGEVTATHDMTSLNPDLVASAAAGFLGAIEQIPPMVSAIKIDGKRLHELAREGIEVERQPRPVEIARFDTSPTDDPLVYSVDVECSSGTYIRTLAADLGTALGGGAHLRALRRHSVGAFSLADSVQLDALTPDSLRPAITALAPRTGIEVDDETAAQLRNGNVLVAADFASSPDDDGPWPVIDRAGALLAVLVRHKGNRAKPSVVLVSSD